jgi:nucleotide-binding universal stress UspA family protein
VRAWTEPGIDLGMLRPDRIAEWDHAEERVLHDLEIALSPWPIIHPELDVRVVAVQDRPAELLVALSHRARMVVVGRSERGGFLGGFSESPVSALLREARCPVLVVPAEGPPRTPWLPGRARAVTAR